MKILRRVFLILLLLLLVAITIALGYYYVVTKDFSLQPEKLVFNEKNVVLYDGIGQEIKNTSASFSKQTVCAQDIPNHVKQAFIDTEDKRFYKHSGFDVKRIFGASWQNVKSRSFKEGASTISQQLIKNTHLSQEKTIKRKLQEWKLTRQLEKKYSKEQILEKYLNTIYFGHSCFGIKAAAEFYFGKSVSQLTLSDGAILAALVKSPNNYSPFRNPENCAKRKETVLNLMFTNGSITAQEKNEALCEALPKPTKEKQNTGYLHFVFDEFSAIAEEKGFKVGGKIEIRTFLDQELQNELENLRQSEISCDKAFFVFDNETKGFKGALSTIGNARRLPGSLIKPLLVYAPALEENVLSPATPILDEKINYNGYSPTNYDGQFHGYVSMRECVEKSLNVPAVKTLETLGIQKASAYMQKLGLPINDADKSLALALGGMQRGYSLQDVTNAYSTLACKGIYEKGSFIQSITVNEKQVYKKETKKISVFSEESAYLMTDVLKSTTQNGTAKKLRGLTFDIAAKTGTVGTSKGNTDAYALSYTTKDCVSVWLGNANNSKIEYTGGGMPCNLLLKINEYLSEKYFEKNTSIPPFPQPKNVVEIKLDRPQYYATHTLTLADDIAPPQHTFLELFKKSAIPLNKSTSFTNPTIIPPTLSLSGNNVTITFDKSTPTYYTYKIDRYDYATHTTIYEGNYIPKFTDCIKDGKRYVYTVTPLYNNRMGTPISLPSIYSEKSKTPIIEESELLEKDWWKY